LAAAQGLTDNTRFPQAVERRWAKAQRFKQPFLELAEELRSAYLGASCDYLRKMGNFYVLRNARHCMRLRLPPNSLLV
jgi:hypothetical protein